MPFHACARSPACRSPATIRLPAVPRPKAVLSSCAQITISHGCRGTSPAARLACTTSSAASVPRSPSKLPPVGTESMCEPKRIAGPIDGCRGRRPSRENVAGRIDPRRQPGGAHLVGEPRSRGDIGVGVGHAAHAGCERPALGPSEHAEPFQACAEARGIDRRPPLARTLAASAEDRRGHQCGRGRRQERAAGEHGRECGIGWRKIKSCHRT